MDEAGSMVRIKAGAKKGIVNAEDIATVVSKITGIPVNKVAEAEGVRLFRMRERLKERIIGQDEAIDTIVSAIQRSRAGLKDPDRPIGSFLFSARQEWARRNWPSALPSICLIPRTIWSEST